MICASLKERMTHSTSSTVIVLSNVHFFIDDQACRYLSRANNLHVSLNRIYRETRRSNFAFEGAPKAPFRLVKEFSECQRARKQTRECRKRQVVRIPRVGAFMSLGQADKTPI